jgi:Lrp/AsnC family transcriptional regulator, leucine-responsive regulatory protein
MDDIDRQIVALLRQDARRSFQSIGLRVSLSAPAVKRRVDRLEADGVIRGYHADVDPEALGLPLAAVIAVSPRDAEHEYDIPDRLAALPQIESCHSVAGEDSFVLFVRVATPTELEALIREIRRRADVSTRTTVVLQTFFERVAMPPNDGSAP